MKIANVNSINDLTAEVARLNKKCNELESERKTLGSRLSANSSEAHLQIRELQRVSSPFCRFCFLFVLYSSYFRPNNHSVVELTQPILTSAAHTT